MSKMKEKAMDNRDTVVGQLAEACLRLCNAVDLLKMQHVLPDASLTGLNYALDDAKGEARNMLRILGVIK